MRLFVGNTLKEVSIIAANMLKRSTVNWAEHISRKTTKEIKRKSR